MLASSALAEPGDPAGAPAQQPSVAVAAPDPEPTSDPQPLIIATGEVAPPANPPMWTPPLDHRWHMGVAIGAAFGVIWVEDVERGYYGRLEAGAYEVQRRRGGLIAGMLAGLEAWAAPGAGERTDWGAGMPMILYGGLQADAAFAVLGAGFDLVLFDRIAQQSGFGFFAPEGAANLGVDLEGVRFLADSRLSYRWQIGAPDRLALRLGLSLQITTD